MTARQDLENSFDAALLTLSRLSAKAKESDEMALYYASNRAWHELDAARVMTEIYSPEAAIIFGRAVCPCGILATHTIALFDINGEPTGKKQLACDTFPECLPKRQRICPDCGRSAYCAVPSTHRGGTD